MSFYYDDAVFRWTGGDTVEFGMILDGGSYFDSNSSQNADDAVHVAWFPFGSEDCCSEGDVSLLERYLAPGDFVRRRTTESGVVKLGTCKRCAETFCQARIAGSRRVLRDVFAKRLIPLETFRVNQHILYRGWIGVIEDIRWEVVLTTPDGRARAVASGPEACAQLRDLDPGRDHFPTYMAQIFYPGQQLWGTKSFLQTLFWTGSPAILDKTGSSIVRVIVKEHRTVNISVVWFCAVKSKSVSQPTQYIPKEEFRFVKIINEEHFQPHNIGMYCLYRPRRDEPYITLTGWRDMLIEEHLQKDPKITKGPYSRIISCIDRNTGRIVTDELEKISPIDFKDNKSLSDTKREALQRKVMSNIDKMLSHEAVSESIVLICEDLLQDAISTVSTPKGNSFQSRVALSEDKNKKKVNPVAQLGIRQSRRKRQPSLSYTPSLGHKWPTKKLVPAIRRLFDDGTPLLYEAVVVEILRTKSTLEVEWQDGSKEIVPSSDLLFVEQFDNLEFFPGDFVVEQKPSGEPGIYGVVLSADYKERTAKVNWFKSDPKNKSPPVLLREKEEVSVYDISDHNNFSFKVGSCVVYLANYEMEGDGSENCGQIIDILTNGKIRVALASGAEILCYPQEICFIFEHSRFEDIDFEEEDSGSWETLSNASSPRYDTIQDPKTARENDPFERIETVASTIRSLLRNMCYTIHDPEKLKSLLNLFIQILRLFKFMSSDISLFLEEENNQALALHFQNTDVMSKLNRLFKDVISIFGFNKREELRDLLEELYSVAQIKTRETPFETDAENKMSESFFSTTSEEILSIKIPAFPLDLDEKSPLTTPHSEILILEDDTANDTCAKEKIVILDNVPESHYFATAPFLPFEPLEFQRRVFKEIKLLKTSLPDGILVKGFANRIDLYTVLLHGPNGTPYEDGLFFFDIALPNLYPKDPPLVHYISYCSEKLNPNLYEEGRVCISLLGTWSGEGDEAWNPSKSNLLQVLVSIQGLILVSEPYFNEAGYDKQVGTEKGRENSRIYNEVVLLKVVQSMARMTRDPLETFQEEIREHLHAVGDRMIERLEKWSQQYEVHSVELPPDVPRPEFLLFPISKGFSLSMRSILQIFRQALEQSRKKDLPDTNSAELQ